jgi:hypothetical protein
MVEHRVVIEAQMIADQLMVKCSCGWRQAISFLDVPHGVPHSVVWDYAKRLKAAHERGADSGARARVVKST